MRARAAKIHQEYGTSPPMQAAGKLFGLAQGQAHMREARSQLCTHHWFFSFASEFELHLAKEKNRNRRPVLTGITDFFREPPPDRAARTRRRWYSRPGTKKHVAETTPEDRHREPGPHRHDAAVRKRATAGM